MNLNILIKGDCLSELNKIDSNSVDLIYLDPPFFTQKKQILKTRDNSKIYYFDDTWKSILEYRNFIKERLMECKNILKETGSIFLHCDRSASHHLRIMLDEVFGEDNFQSEIVWSYRRWSNAKKGLLNSHQIIFFYSKTKKFKFNHIFENYSLTTNIDQIFQKRTRDKNGKTKYRFSDNGECELMESKKGVPLSDVWEIPYLNPKANERAGYPTQKPILLLERIINLVTNEDDIVLDPFCGSGTTLVAAKLLNRKYIGIDKSNKAIELSKKRLENPIKSESGLIKKGEDAYFNQEPEIIQILGLIDAIPVQRNKGIDGFLRIDNFIKPVPVKVQRNDETIDRAKRLLTQAANKNGFKQKILIKTNNTTENTLFELSKDYPSNLLIIDDLEEFLKNKKAILKIS